MALRNQPYFPLYVQDYLTDEKLNMCSASTQGIYIKILCIFHKSEAYGGILFKENNKQNYGTKPYFAYAIQKQIGFSDNEIESALEELVENKVLTIDGDFMFQKRMVQDFAISLKRSESGKKGGGSPILFKQKVKQTVKQNPEYENENEIINEDMWLIQKKRFLENEVFFYKFCTAKNITKNNLLIKANEFINDIDLKQDYKNVKELQKHFTNWFNIKIKNDGVDKKGLSYESDQRIAASIEYANRYRESNK
jgi:hypothetical protein